MNACPTHEQQFPRDSGLIHEQQFPERTAALRKELSSLTEEGHHGMMSPPEEESPLFG